MEYDRAEDKEPYKAAAINRFRSSWYDIHLFASFWRITETAQSIHTFMKTPGAYRFAKDIAELSPDMIRTVLIDDAYKVQKVSIESLYANPDVPSNVRKALSSLHQATANLIGSDGHRRALRYEGNAYTMRFGPPLLFTTPNVADDKQVLLLVVQGEEYHLTRELTETYRDMKQRLAADPVGQVIVFELMIKLFFQHVLGIDETAIGWPRGGGYGMTGANKEFGLAFDGAATGAFGKVAAAFGPIEAQGRGSLHPHILVWLHLTSMQETLDLLRRDHAQFQTRITDWMQQLMSAVAMVQNSAVTELPGLMSNGVDKLEVEQLPFGVNERDYYKADGEAEKPSEEEIPISQQDRRLYVPSRSERGQWVEAERPLLPYINSRGEEVSREIWLEQQMAESKGIWGFKVRKHVCAKCPEYALNIEDDGPRPEAGIQCSVESAIALHAGCSCSVYSILCACNAI